MFFNIQSFLVLCIFVREFRITESHWGELIDLGRARSGQNLSYYKFSNCSMFNIAYGSTCTCSECNEERCTICCNSPGFTCCYCHACLTTCWKNDWQLISAAQVGMSTALLIATVATIALFFRICNRGYQLGRHAVTGNRPIGDTQSRVSVSSVQQYIISRLQDRPPQYNDSAEAPPLYDADPANRVATIEAPPKYSRKPRESENTIESESTTRPSAAPDVDGGNSVTTVRPTSAITNHI